MANDMIHPHTRMAMGETPPDFKGDFGIEQLNAHRRKEHPDNGSKAQSATLKEHKRGARHPIPNRKSANQAQPDHGEPDYL